MSYQPTLPSRPYYDRPAGSGSKRIELVKLVRRFGTTVRKCIDIGYTEEELHRAKLYEVPEQFLMRLTLFGLKQCKDFVEKRPHLYAETSESNETFLLDSSET